MKTRLFDPFSHMSKECMKLIIKGQGLEISSLREAVEWAIQWLDWAKGVATDPEDADSIQECIDEARKALAIGD